MEQELSSAKNITTENELLRCALNLFATKGYFNTSLVDISNQAQLANTQQLYVYFENKQQIAHQLYSTVIENLSFSIDEIRKKNQKASEQLRSLVDLLFKLCEDAPDTVRFLLNVNIAEILPNEKNLLQSSAGNKMLKIIQHGISNGEIRSLAPALIYSYFFGIIYTTLQLILNGPLDKKTELYHSQAWFAAWNAIAKK